MNTQECCKKCLSQANPEKGWGEICMLSNCSCHYQEEPARVGSPHPVGENKPAQLGMANTPCPTCGVVYGEHEWEQGVPGRMICPKPPKAPESPKNSTPREFKKGWEEEFASNFLDEDGLWYKAKPEHVKSFISQTTDKAYIEGHIEGLKAGRIDERGEILKMLDYWETRTDEGSEDLDKVYKAIEREIHKVYKPKEDTSQDPEEKRALGHDGFR